ncbi:MAG: DUF4325 domain-containing protein [Thiofilum sp.]|uniref:STAS-like domain-containing protein n=1 Tax=Thiofilum sp. TaxID=2212733 RepID=UPI0025EE1B1E|nr:DUF4325 domain-containing protein [Thiofilum sp.]MBK8454244.1 DUF4325 domain-containing protein [Thiofilum sp.]
MNELINNTRAKTAEIRQFIIENVANHPNDLSHLTAQQFDISRQAVNRHLQELVKQELLEVSGATRNKAYKLKVLDQWQQTYDLQGLDEDRVWRNDILPRFARFNLAKNVQSIWHYGFTEMLNNAIDHSNSSVVFIKLVSNAAYSWISIYDQGEGIFRKIQKAMDLEDERHAVLELSKGKLTTDPANHSGEGIFFSSRIFDQFIIDSNDIIFSHEHDKIEDWIVESTLGVSGTLVGMKLHHNTQRTTKEIFDFYTSDDGDYRFVKTVVPVRLAQYGNEELISRSQAKRVLSRIERFKVVIFDFEGVESIGQAFADEVFRVFKNQHAELELKYENANPDTEAMIRRALTHS